uniref:Kinesin motor domain-containing protein n=1 Tax=Trichogramma kaykai TaxID=54128 RepID=A0ABD2VXV7_9HYME
MTDDLVKVAVRIRPMIQSELDKGSQTCLNVIPGQQQIHIPSAEKAFTFNYVFASDSSQEHFYNSAIKNMVSNIFEGYNVTILAYGQTGSGKTFSMGTNYNENDANCGIIPRAVHDIFEQIGLKKDWDFTVTVSFMELYKEQLYDLLSKKPRNQCAVDIREDVKGIRIVGLTEVPVNDTASTLQCLADGSLCRATGATAMNVQSSRSHAIFTISVKQEKKNEPDSAKFAKFHLVDLAGSERSKKTQATGERFKEGVNINKGLLALGNVISQLGENGNSSYVGYRDSKLTRLLQDSLGGNSVTLMIACVSPADYNIEETISTLRYADRAKKIKNKPIVNQDPHIAEITNLKKIIKELQSALYTSPDVNNGNSCPPEHQELVEKNRSLQRKLRGLTETLNSNLAEMVHMHELADLAEQSREQFKTSIAAILEDCENLLKEFDSDSSTMESQKTKLENICFKIMAIQKEQKEAIDKLVTYELSMECNNDLSTNSEILSNSIENPNIHNETYDLDEKHEEHTLQQAERVEDVQYINRQLAIKEELVSNLLKNSSQVAEYQKELDEMEQEIKTLHAEKDELLQQLKNVQANNASAKLAEARRKKVQELEKKIAELQRKCLEQNKVIKNKEKSDIQIKSLSNEITNLKQTKVKLIRSMRSETDKFNKWKRSREQELVKLKDQDRKRLNQINKMQAEHNKQKNVFRRKMEEAQAIQKRLKDALDLQKRATLRKEKTANAKDDIHAWVTQELEVLLSTVYAECTLNKLKKDKAVFAKQLAELQLQKESQPSQSNQAQISELMEFVELRNKQIKNLEQNIQESNQENRAKTRWQALSSMTDAKEALKTLFDITAAKGKDFSLLQSKYHDLEETVEKMKAQIEKYEIRESNSKLRKKDLGLPEQRDDLLDDSEKDTQIEQLKQQVEEYKQKIDILENRILTEHNSNSKESRHNRNPKPKPKPLTDLYETSFGFTDESIINDDDDENDPDWTKTPLYNRIQKLEKTTKNVGKDITAVPMKRSFSGEVKCSCKTQCSSRLCTCRRNEVSCGNCNCDPNLCQNQFTENVRNDNFKKLDYKHIFNKHIFFSQTRRTLFTDVKTEQELENSEMKKPNNYHNKYNVKIVEKGIKKFF